MLWIGVMNLRKENLMRWLKSITTHLRCKVTFCSYSEFVIHSKKSKNPNVMPISVRGTLLLFRIGICTCSLSSTLRLCKLLGGVLMKRLLKCVFKQQHLPLKNCGIENADRRITQHFFLLSIAIQRCNKQKRDLIIVTCMQDTGLLIP